MPKSPSSVWPWTRSALAGLSTITLGTPTWRARSHTCDLKRSPSGFTGGESSACQVKYPKSRSVLFPVPSGSAPSADERSNSVIMRVRAITLPRRPGVVGSPMSAASASTALEMSTVRSSMPSSLATRSACVRLSLLEAWYGMRTPMTFSGPSASAARYATSELSTPPESPRMPFLNPRRLTTSSLRNSTSQRRVSSASMASGSSAPLGRMARPLGTRVAQRRSLEPV